jgi:hypothetical protein
MALLIFVGYGRLRWQLTRKRKTQRTFDAYERALRIQERRDRKFGGR